VTGLAVYPNLPGTSAEVGNRAVNSVRFRSLWRTAACAALLAFAVLPHGHLRGHEAVAGAWTAAQQAAEQVAAAPPQNESGRHIACPLCLSMARTRDALVAHATTPSLPVLPAETQLAPPPPALLAEAPALAHASPRAPPLG
jgi:hypothetical protein